MYLEIVPMYSTLVNALSYIPPLTHSHNVTGKIKSTGSRQVKYFGKQILIAHLMIVFWLKIFSLSFVNISVPKNNTTHFI